MKVAVRNEGSPMPSRAPYDGSVNAVVSYSAPICRGTLLLVESVSSTRALLQRVLTTRGFSVTVVDRVATALAAASDCSFTHAVIGLDLERRRLPDDHGLALITKLRAGNKSMRIVATTECDSFARVILTLRAGADDYLPKPVKADELIDALLDETPAFPPVPETPLRIERTRWEHIQRIFEQCERNVSETARRLGMHRRSLQRVLSKRAPHPRGPLRW